MSWTRFFRRRYWDQERARELESYIDSETAENIARGMTPDDARYAARRKLGNPLQIREEIYRMNSLGFLEALWNDLGHAVRLLRINPAFAVVAIASLALGIGANTAIFQLIDAIRLRTLPVKNPHQLMQVRVDAPAGVRGSINSPYSPLTYALWEQIQKRQQVFSGVFAFEPSEFGLGRAGDGRTIQGLWVSGDFFRVLDVAPAAGRLFADADDHRGCGTPGAVISYGFWQSEFAASHSALGKTLTLDGHPVEIIGVTAPGFTGLEVGRRFDVAIPICSQASLYDYSYLDDGTIWWLTVVGRLKPGATLANARAYLAAVCPGIFEASLPPNYPRENIKDYLGSKLSAVPAGTGVSTLRDQYSAPLWMLLAIAAMVLLIACANLANLMLARAAAREREIAVRLALGASRGRVFRQLIVESLLIASAGAALGAFLAQNLTRFLVAFLSPEGSPIFIELHPDWRVLSFTASVAALTCLLFGLTPAIRAAQTAPGAALKSGGRSMTIGRERFGFRRALVAVQVALSFVLLVGAVLFSRSLQKLVTLDAGFRQDGILIADLDISQPKIPVARWDAFKQNLIDRIRAIPGVDSAAEAKVVPLSGNASDDHVWMEGASERINSYFNWISPDYFKTLGTPLIDGRDFSRHDSRTAPKVAIVNEAFARRLGIIASPIGKRFRREATTYEPQTVFEIVGLVKDAKYRSLREEFTPTVFLPITQLATPEPSQHIFIRSATPLAPLVAAVKSAVGAVSPDIALDFQTLKTQIREGLLRERLMAMLSGFFGFLAAVLAAIGLYGVMAYTVAQRTNEIGIRMALGADPRSVVKMILEETGRLVAAGMCAGLALALAAARLARSLLFGIQPHDPVAVVAAMALLATVALMAGYIPVRRAAHLDPMTALRDE
ncbi:MAG TPA: ABC transporter permease [Bryobacteraceae bacterium]|nr:ABC transporter permease [Bryobacteraceae bacterium]